MRHHGRVGFLVGTLLALVCGGGSADARETRDRISLAPDNQQHVLTRVAVLPAVSVTGDALAEQRAEAGWVATYGRGRTSWVRADEVSLRIADPALGDLARETRAQIWRNGAVDSQTAARLCRVLGVDAVVSLRVDRWELAECRGMVEMTVTMSGADGGWLWAASGHAGYGRRVLPDTDANEHPDHRTCTAYSTLLARWAAQLPAAMQQGEASADVLALLHAD